MRPALPTEPTWVTLPAAVGAGARALAGGFHSVDCLDAIDLVHSRDAVALGGDGVGGVHDFGLGHGFLIDSGDSGNRGIRRLRGHGGEGEREAKGARGQFKKVRFHGLRFSMVFSSSAWTRCS